MFTFAVIFVTTITLKIRAGVFTPAKNHPRPWRDSRLNTLRHQGINTFSNRHSLFPCEMRRLHSRASFCAACISFGLISASIEFSASTATFIFSVAASEYQA